MVNRDGDTGRMPVTPSSQGDSDADFQSANNTFKPLDKDAEIVRRSRDLPHWEQVACTYFVTFRLADSLPQSELERLREEKEIWLRHHPKPWTVEDKETYRHRFTSRVHRWLDAGYGSCALKDPDIGRIVESALRHFDGDRYFLDPAGSEMEL